jgi:outer membrane biosynthesis protein TonB
VPVVGSRFLIEAGFIIAVAVIAGIERLSTWWIIAVVASAWLIVAAVEIVVWARQVVARQPLAQAPEPRPVQNESRAPTLPPPVPEPRREPVAVSTPAPPPPLVALPPPPAQPEPEPVAEPVAETARVVPFPANDSPREWNLWELERAARDHASDDVARNEERAYLLMYLREFAGPDGMLPADFDGLVRDAFADLLHAVA